MVVTIMVEIKLQFSIVCEWSDGKNIRNVINGFTPGQVEQFYIVNKWIWDEGEENLDMVDLNDCYQETGIVEKGNEEKVIALSHSDSFRVKNSHTHVNCFHDLTFQPELAYRVRVKLFDRKGESVEMAGIDYPLLVKEVDI